MIAAIYSLASLSPEEHRQIFERMKNLPKRPTTMKEVRDWNGSPDDFSRWRDDCHYVEVHQLRERIKALEEENAKLKGTVNETAISEAR